MDIQAVQNSGVNPADSQMQQAPSREAATERTASSDSGRVSDEAVKLNDLVNQVQSMPDVRPESVAEAIQNVQTGVYQTPEAMAQTSSALFEQI